LTEISRRVIGCAIEVHKELGPGYPVGVYTNALSLELGDEEIGHSRDEVFEVFYGDDKIGDVKADFFISGRFLVRMMAVSTSIGGQERSELRAQLRAADVELGLIINFGERRLKDGLVRVLNPDKLNATRDANAGSDDSNDDADEDDGDGDNDGDD
jgi:GxxExxY protein